METKLFIAPSPGAKAATIVKPAWTPPPKAKIEDTMETIGETFFYMGIFGAVVFGIGAFAAFISHEQPLVGVSLVLIAIISLAQGFIVQALFLWCGEVIRLLRANKR